MSLANRLVSLKARHAELEAELSEEESRPLPDARAVAELKRSKLRVKDEIFRVEGEMPTAMDEIRRMV